MALHEYGKGQDSTFSPADIPETTDIPDTELLAVLHNLRFNDEELISRTVAYLNQGPIRQRLLAWLADPDNPFLGLVVNASRFLRLAGAVPRLQEIAVAETGELALGAIHALVSIADPNTVPLYIDKLEDEDDQVRFMAAAGIGYLGRAAGAQAAAALEAAIARETVGYVEHQLKAVRDELASGSGD